jgi:2-polyprenyl-3-methyl-5-hydroxy-6-metoxy-1,4-benzoquinol methylase
LEYVNCNLCGADDAMLLYPSTLPKDRCFEDDVRSFRCTSSGYGVHPSIVQCRSCGLVYANPRYEDSTILHNYEEAIDRLYMEEREGRVLTFRRNLRPLEKLVAPVSGRKLLDVGCHIGVFLEIAQGRGWEAWGVEPSRWATEQAQRRGLRVMGSTLKGASFAGKFFDVVTMWDVIEHLTDPINELQEVNRVLKKDGLVCIHTMNIESLFARLMGPRWPWLMEMHLYYFSPWTLAKMLEKTGFRVIRTITQGRFLRLGYLISRFKPYSKRTSRLLQRLVKALQLTGVPVPINLGDLFTTYARKT